MNSVFQIEALSFSYDHKQNTLTDLNVDIEQGKITSLLGKNGSGKTTLLNILAKNYLKFAGKVIFKGKSLSDYSKKKYARELAIVYQKNNIPEELSVYDLVAFGRLPHKKTMISAPTQEDIAKIEFALETTKLAELKDSPVTYLSGGQVQRAFLAMALAQGTDTILLDEPTTFLDVEYQKVVMNFVRELNRKFGYTIIMVLHDINQALQYSDNVVALNAGRIISAGASTEFYDSAILRRIYDTDIEVVRHEDKKILISW